MANICKYKGIIKGKKNSCYMFFGSMPCLDNKEIIEEYGTKEEFYLKFEGDCKWHVDAYCKPWEGSFPVKVPDDQNAALVAGHEYWYYTVQERSKMFEVEVFCNSADIDDYIPAFGLNEIFMHFINGNEADLSYLEELRIGNEYADDWNEQDYSEISCSFPIITFGSYPQNEEGESEPIEWFVLNKDDEYQLLISKYVIEFYEDTDFSDYLDEKKQYLWENSKCREWLNSEFYNKAFNAEEKAQVVISHVVNDVNPEYETDGGNDTYDKVFLLSIDEANEYFDFDEDRATTATPYAEDKGAWNTDDTGKSRWFLRSPGESEYKVAYVSAGFYGDDIGEVEYSGDHLDEYSIRPVICIKNR